MSTKVHVVKFSGPMSCALALICSFPVVATAECLPPASVCSGQVVSGYCSNAACFDVSSGAQVRVTAADDLGPYPRKWKMWAPPATEVTFSECTLAQKSKKFDVVIPVGLGATCSIGLWIDGSPYYETITADPDNQCLQWVECGPVVPPPSISPSLGSVGSPVTIDDPMKRLEPGDQIRFYLAPNDPLAGAAATDVWVSEDGSRIVGLVPSVPANVDYSVAVVSSTGEIRFTGLSFRVTV